MILLIHRLWFCKFQDPKVSFLPNPQMMPTPLVHKLHFDSKGELPWFDLKVPHAFLFKGYSLWCVAFCISLQIVPSFLDVIPVEEQYNLHLEKYPVLSHLELFFSHCVTVIENSCDIRYLPLTNIFHLKINVPLFS